VRARDCAGGSIFLLFDRVRLLYFADDAECSVVLSLTDHSLLQISKLCSLFVREHDTVQSWVVDGHLTRSDNRWY
jgi:hypothetical protein